MKNNEKWIITTDSFFNKNETLYLAWQEPAWDEDGYFWTWKDVFKELENQSTLEHPFIFVSRKAAIRKLKKLNIPCKCRVVKWEPEAIYHQVKIDDLRKHQYENWNHYNYENYNKCPCCNGEIRMTGSVSEYQVFKCSKCEAEFVLNAITEEIEYKNKK